TVSSFETQFAHSPTWGPLQSLRGGPIGRTAVAVDHPAWRRSGSTLIHRRILLTISLLHRPIDRICQRNDPRQHLATVERPTPRLHRNRRLPLTGREEPH